MLVLLASGVAEADPERVIVLDAEVAPSLPGYVRKTTETSVAEGLASSGYTVVRASATSGLPPELAGCTQGPCLDKLAAALSASAVIMVKVSGKDDSTIIEITMFDAGHSAEPVATVREICDLCGNSELVDRIALATSSVKGRAEEGRARRAASAHPVQAPPPPSPKPAPVIVARRTLSIPGVALASAGGLVIAGGIYLLAIDGDGTCSPGDKPEYPDPGAVIRYPDPSNHSLYVCRDRYATKLVGGLTLGAGAAVVALGVALLVRGSTEHVVVNPTANGAVVGARLSW
jgi:hypothetical protein